MRLSEVRLIRSDRGGEHKRYRLAIGQGVTFVCGSFDDAGSSFFSDLHLSLISDRRNDSNLQSRQIPSFGDSRFTPRRKIYSDHWEFILTEDESSYRLSPDKGTQGQIDFFSQVIIGDEGTHLGRQIDFPLLSDRHAADGLKRESFVALRERLVRSRQALRDESTGRGKLVSTIADYESCQRDLTVLKRDILPDDQLVSLLDEEEKSITKLKKEDDVLAREQRLMTLLERKSEYETLLELRRELKEIEEREGRYGARITELGHDITVHELTSLAQWRANAAEVKRDVLRMQDSAQLLREEKAKLEQNRIMLAHSLRKNQELRDSLLDEYEYLALKSDEEHERLINYGLPPEEKTKARPFPSAFHFSILASLLALAIGLLLVSVVKTVGIILIVLAVSGLAAIFLSGPIKRIAGSKETSTTAKHLGKEELRSRISDIDQSIRHDGTELDGMDEAINVLERDMAQRAIEIETAERQLKRLNDDLLRMIKKYAGPSEIHEIDDIIETLSKQRESSASHNEAIADLLRRIADLKHGRSDEDMVREYENVCEQLYGGSEFDSIGEGDQRNRIKTLQLHYDPLRAKQISEERVEIARLIDEKSALVKNMRAKLVRSQESSIGATSLRNRCAMLEHSISEMENDLSKLNKSIAWLDQVLATWHEKDDIMTVMAKAVRYVGRISGRRTGDTLPMMPLDPTVQRIRRPGFLEHTVSPYTSPVSIDPAAFNQTTAEQNYLALRLAWATQRLSTMPEGSPILLMAPAIPPEYSQMEELVNALEEWTLETGRQVVFFTTANYIADIAMNRNMVVYRLE